MEDATEQACKGGAMTQIPLHALEIVVSKHLAGSKLAYQFGNGPVYVSPAMFDLMKHATPDELETLLKSIRIKHLPPMPDFSRMGMTTMFTQEGGA